MSYLSYLSYLAYYIPRIAVQVKEEPDHITRQHEGQMLTTEYVILSICSQAYAYEVLLL